MSGQLGIRPLHMIALVMEFSEVKPGPFTVTKPPAILGTCFAFRRPTIFLTANHVIKKHDPATLAVSFLTIGGLRPVTTLHAHPQADLAILEAQDPQTGPIEPVTGILHDIHLGEMFAAFGFPSDLVFGQAGGSPHRLLLGHYQRFMDFESINGYRYVAGEMNVACPKGMSGGPLLRPEAPQFVSALAAESVDVESYPSLVHETIIDGRSEKVTEKRMIQYGVAVMLGNLVDWVNERVPPLGSA